MSENLINTEEWKPKYNPWVITLAVIIATFVAALNSTIASVALKQIAGSFSATQDESLWVITSYLVASSIILPAVAWFSSIFGRKKFLLLCLFVFIISSFICGISVNMNMMILGRIMQGLGGGVVFPLSQAIIFESFPKKMHGVAMSIFGLGLVLAPILGPIIGGWLTSDFSWNWIFFVSIPACIVSMIMIQKFIEDPPYMQAQGMQKIDFIGFALLILWLVTFQIVLDNGQKSGWLDALWVRQMLSVSGFGFVGLIIWELKNKKPLFDLKIFLNWNFTVGTVIYTIIFAILYGTMTLLPLFLQSMMGYTPFLSGLAGGPMGLGSFIGIIGTAVLANKIDLRKQIAFGLAMLAFACLLFGNLNLNISMINVIIPNIILGCSFSFIIAPLTTLIFSTVKQEDMTNASGLQNLLKNVGSAVGTSLVGTMVSRFAQIHQGYLVDNLNPLNPVFQTKVILLTKAFSRYFHPFVATSKANYYMYLNMVKQSVFFAYMESYRIYALIAIILIPLIFLIKKVDYKKE